MFELVIVGLIGFALGWLSVGLIACFVIPKGLLR